ncbi:hypothetical protein B0H14DRAFT_2220306, partial [Mycena olivaceomarginata]
SLCGCTVGFNIAVLSVVLVKQDEGEIVGLTDDVPKRVNNIQCFFNLSKEDVAVGDHREEGGHEAVYQGMCALLCHYLQDLVPGAPIRLQCPCHLKLLIHRRTEHQKEQKAEFE